MEDPDVIGTKARKLSDGAGDSSMKTRVNTFFLNEAYGSFFLNMIADVVVRCMCAILLPLLGCCLAFGCCRKGKKRKEGFSKRQLQQLSDIWEERGRAIWVSEFAKLLEADHSHSAAESENPTSTSSTSQNLKSHGSEVLDNFSRDGDDNIVPDAVSHSPKLNGYVDQIQTPEKRPLKADVRKRPNGVIKQLQTGSDGRFVKHGGTPGGMMSGEAASTLTSEKLSVEPRSVSTSSSGGSTTGISTGVLGCAQYEHILDIPVVAVLPSSASLESGDALKGIFKVKLAIKFIQDMCSSRILQAWVKPTRENLRALRDLAVEGMKIDKEFTLQIDRFFMFHCKDNPEEPVLLSLRDVEVPTILQAEYVAGVLTIKGHYLEGAEIRAATLDEYLILHPEKQEKGNEIEKSPHPTEIEEWRCTNLLLPAKLDKVYVFASKKVCIQKEYVTVRSEALPLIDNTISTVMREWIPAAILILFTFLNLLPLMATVMNFSMILQFPQLWLPHLAPGLVIYILQMLPSSVETGIQSLVNQLKIFFAIFKFKPLLESTFTKRMSANSIERDSQSSSSINAKHIGDKDMEEKRKDLTKNQGTGNQSPIDLDWKWMTLKQKYSKSMEDWVTLPTESTKKVLETLPPFEVIYREHQKNYNLYSEFERKGTDSGSTSVFVKIYSKGLQLILQNLIPRRLIEVEDYAQIEAKYIFQVYLQGALNKTMDFDPIISNDESSGEVIDLKTLQLHIFHLIRFIESEFETTILQHQKMINTGVISWDMLWTLFQENEKVIYYCDLSKEELCGKVLSSQYTREEAFSKKRPSFLIELEVWDYDCVSYEPKIIARKISEFFQERNISSLDVHPIKLQKDVAKTEAFFLNRGKMYHELVLSTERHFLEYKGTMFWSFIDKFRYRGTFPAAHRESMDGRVMIDQGSYAKMKSHRYMGTAQPANGWMQGSLVRDKNLPTEDDANLQFAPTIVYGFSFPLRKWGCFLIPQLEEITFSPTAFDTLVMKEEQTKKMLLAMTEHFIKRPKQRSTTKEKVGSVDPLPNKGKGSIILLHGPPGTGKTLTVEALAEKMECPLWQLSVSTLNMKPKKLETRLMKKFEIAALWGAIMLLDEADVYLSPRNYSPLAPDASKGNALTGVFLRILEYYKGILFLTTNQINHFEPAIYSRISLFVRYEEFDLEQRRQLWNNFMKRAGIEKVTSTFWKEVLPIQLNGRVIRNIVSNAEILCEGQGKQLNEDYVLESLRVMTHVTIRSLFSIEEKGDERDGQDSMSLGGSLNIHHQWSVSDNQSA
ncbi:hypothetical protein M758_8G148100 [Ceratodon purpureus]|nr:hypothetical protein M758_8G148100 [Ceratodon purpureus]